MARRFVGFNLCYSFGIMIFDVPILVDSILEAVLTVSPNKQYLGIVNPTTPATQGPGKESIHVLNKS